MVSHEVAFIGVTGNSICWESPCNRRHLNLRVCWLS